MDPLMTIYRLLELATGGASLAAQSESGRLANLGTNRGYNPGTVQADQELVGQGQTGISAIDSLEPSTRDAFRNALNELGRYSPTGATYLAQLAENQGARGRQNTYLDRNIENATNSPLKGLAEDVGTFRTDSLERIDAQKAQSAAARGRAGATEGRRDEITGKVQGVADETQKYFTGVRDNPNIYSPTDIERMASTYADNQHAQEALATSSIEDSAAARGLAPGAVAALKAIAASSGGQAIDANRRDLMVQNAVQSAGRGDQAATTMAQLLGSLYGTKGNLDTAYTTVAEDQYGKGDAIDQWIEETRGTLANALFGTQAGIQTQYEGGVTNANLNRASNEQPENLMLPGQLLDEINRFNNAIRSGTEAEKAAAYSALLGTIAQVQAGQTQANSAWDAVGSTNDTGAGLLNSTLGNLTGFGLNKFADWQPA
ncbi:MAG: hypothetical protein PHU85_00270 [Phycisphaerae bacterium]|nr:hypothetical protein [Phycisphaerae bacterium]